jgi:hypothetical protein
MADATDSDPQKIDHESDAPPGAEDDVPGQPKSEAQIDKELKDSFPTSDPPSSWAGAD